MNLSFLTPLRTVLLVSDDALYIYSCAGTGTRQIAVVPWNTDGFVREVSRILIKDCNKKPVLILNDMVEQHYRKERVIKKGIGVLDKGTMLERKLQFAFPNYPIRAYFPLKEKIQQTESVAAADIYIFAAIPNSDQFKLLMEAVNKSFVAIAGVCLLPVESADMVKTLSDKSEKDKAQKSKWIVFLSQHQSGGLRQIVTKDGEIALTRMTPITASQTTTPEVWAAEVVAEFSATMSYVSRFGFQPEDGLNVIMLAETVAGKAFQTLIEESYDCHATTLEDAAKALNIPLGRQDEEVFGNVLHVAWAGRKNKFTLPMRAAFIDRVSKPRQAALAASLLLFCSAAYFSYQSVSATIDITSAKSDLSDKTDQLAKARVEHEAEIKKREALGIDVKLVQASVDLFADLEKKKLPILPFFRGLGEAMGSDMRVDSVQIEPIKDVTIGEALAAVVGAAETQQKPFTYIANMQITYPSNANIEVGNQEIEQLTQRLRQALPEHEANVTKALGDYDYDSNLQIGRENPEENVQQDFSVAIEIKGRAKE